MDYDTMILKQVIVIDKIYSIHYFEYASDFSFSGETHNFWEFLCVDKGEVNVVAGSQQFALKKDEIIFHKPNEFHNVQSNRQVAPNIVVISFECQSPAMEYFQDRVLTIGEAERNLLAQIIVEAQNNYSTSLDNPYQNKLEKRENAPFGCENLIKLHLEELLILLIRKQMALRIDKQPPRILKQKNDSDLYKRILYYLEVHLYSQLSIEQICKDNLIGRSQLQKLFREQNKCGIIDYFTKMKITLAKQLIRNKQLNFTQIADALGYSSIHYFSRQFKKTTGMTPSEYSSSIKKLSEAPATILPQPDLPK